MTAQATGDATLVYTSKALARMMAHLREQPAIALDTESNSLYSYHSKVCLIQISAPAGGGSPEYVDFLVDPTRLTELAPLGQLLKEGNVEVVMHAAENDMLLLYRSFGFTFGHVFDTQLAARILGWKQVGLAAILEAKFGIVSDKRMQRTNWGKRPLTAEQIAYAQMDTHYLLPLRDLLIQELQEKDRWEEAQEAFAHLARIDYSQRRAEERTFWHMKSVREVPLDHTGVLEALWQWREDEARRLNRPPFKVVNDAVIIELARRLPDQLSDLATVEGMSEQQLRRYGNSLLQTVREGLRRPLPAVPESELRLEILLEKPALARYEALRKWRSEQARLRDVSPDIVLTNSMLLTIAQRNPSTIDELATVPDMGAWKVRAYGADILAITRERRSAASTR